MLRGPFVPHTNHSTRVGHVCCAPSVAPPRAAGCGKRGPAMDSASPRPPTEHPAASRQSSGLPFVVELDRLHGDGDRPEADTGRRPAEPVPVVFYTASIITLDGSDTNAYGEPCEPGTGYTEQWGWWEPDRSYWRVREHRGDVSPDVYPQAERHSPARWLAEQLTARLGAVESYDHGRTFYRGHEAVYPGRLTDLDTDTTNPNPAAAH